MLGKLIKYDIKASAPTLGICYLAVLVLSLLMAGLVKALGGIGGGVEFSLPVNIAIIFTTVLWAVSLAGAAIAALVTVLRRFYRNLMGDEGYLTLTLPVRASTHMCAKTVSGLLILLSGMLMIAVGVLIPAAVAVGMEAEIGEIVLFLRKGLSQVWEELIRGLGTLYLVNQALSAVSGLLFAYLALCIGQLCQQHRILAAIGAYIGIGILEGILQSAGTAILSGTIGRGQDMVWFLERMVTGTFKAGTTVYLICQCVIAFWLSSWILEKKINLR